MHLSKAKITKIALVLLLLASVTLVAMPVEAQLAEEQPYNGPLKAGDVPDVTRDTFASLSFRPNPVGVDQPILVNMWVTPSIHNQRFMDGYVVTITKPDGTQDVIGPMKSYQGDCTAWFEYFVDQVGEWKLKFEFPGRFFPAGRYDRGYVVTNMSGSLLGACYYGPSSTAEQTLTVQEDIVYSWPPSPLPTDYWTRPASLHHREWWPILGGWPGTGYQGGGPMWDELYPDTNPRWNHGYNFHPWVQGPNTAHIVWKRQGADAGLIGGPTGQYGRTGNPGSPNLVYNGRCYDTLTVPVNGVPTSCAVCYDLRTGEMYYAIPTAEGGVTPNRITYLEPLESTRIVGAIAQSSWSVELISISGGYLRKVNPWTGAVSEYSIAPLTGSGGHFYNQMGGYVLAVQNIGNQTDPNYRLINWTTRGSSRYLAGRIISNTTYAKSRLTDPSSEYIDANTEYRHYSSGPLVDFNLGIGVSIAWIRPHNTTGTYEWTRMRGYNLETGAELWDKTIDEPPYSRSCALADHGKVTFLTTKGYWLAYNLVDGSFAWQSERMAYPWGSTSFGAYARQSAYGMFYRQSYDGVYAFNWTNGKIVWRYEAPALSAYENPYINEDGETIYPFNAGGIVADGKMYVYNTEHTASWPMARGWGLHCINITTGELIWKIANPMRMATIADGYLTAANYNDGYMYVFGKGQSQTTVTAPETTVPLGTSVVIKGTVLDMSPAQPGTPCVSKESMSLQMEYLHLQMPIAGLWGNETITGVPVTLIAIGSDGNVIDIGTVTTNGYYGTFSHAWTPPDEDTYEIIASFASDDSYGSSAAATAVSVGPAPPEPPEPVEPEEAADYTPMFAGIIAAVAVAIAIGLVNLYALRKRK